MSKVQCSLTCTWRNHGDDVLSLSVLQSISIQIEGEMQQSKENTLAGPEQPMNGTLATSTRTVAIPRDPLAMLHNTTDFGVTRDDITSYEQPLLKDRWGIRILALRVK